MFLWLLRLAVSRHARTTSTKGKNRRHHRRLNHRSKKPTVSSGNRSILQNLQRRRPLHHQHRKSQRLGGWMKITMKVQQTHC
ncbi:hypothetical protein BDB00DRAFT_858779 [Zychaea mexicana]|uniref:uncharacterized protein n=1 Tax=Zychaea mexicana TaxID=64656 RepID=UPI0022FE9FA1|nr:uncharacterized protein BDB00DRAFT_858779 [Zychaea mexicana]KAI9479490.1 hypothetical protein BDB00DRAFT_858779 [Zychaea mexicana]